MVKYSFDKKSTYVIYGCGEIGNNVASALIENGFSVEAILDINTDCITTVKGIPVLKPDEFKCKSPDSTILIITLNNGLIHEDIAKIFHDKHEINRILYLPMQSNMSEKKKSLMRHAYIDITSGITDISDIPVYNESANSKYRLIDDTGEKWISLWMPIDNMYTISSSESKNKNSSKWAINLDYTYDILISDLITYNELFRYLSTGKGDLDDYYITQGTNKGRKREDILNIRKKLYHIYENEMKYGFSFFTQSPGKAIWDDTNKKIRLKDGYHRSFYLKSKGFSEVPIYMSIEDYNNMIKYEENNNKTQTWNDIFNSEVCTFIYGAAKSAVRVFDTIKDMNPKWISQIKGFLVTDKTNNPDSLIELPVYQADEFEDKNIRVLVPHTAIYRDQIHNHLNNLGYKNFVNIAKLLEIDRDNKNQNNPYSEIGLENYNNKPEADKARDREIANNVLKILKQGDPDFGGTKPYQSLELIGLKGVRPTTYRISRYGLNDILSADMSVLDIGCNSGFIDITIANKVKNVTGVEYDKSLASIGQYVSDELKINNYKVENSEFSEWYNKNKDKKYDAVFSFAIHHWLNLSSKEYSEILDNLLNTNGYLWLESHDDGGDTQYFEIIELLKQNEYKILKDEQIADDGGSESGFASERRFVLMKK